MTVFSRNYRRIEKLLKADFSSECPSYVKFTAGSSFMPLTVEVINKEADWFDLAIAHYFEQNGDLVQDPEMVVRVFPKLGVAEAKSFQNPFGPVVPVYKYEDGKTLVSPSQKREQNSFLEFWLKNIKAQGYQEATRH